MPRRMIPKLRQRRLVHDQLQLLRDALNNAPQARYDTVAIIPNSDMQFPSTPALGHVVRVTDRTVILAQASSNRLKLSNVQVQEFLAKPALSFPVTFATGETMSAFFLTGTFGWGSVDVEVGDRKFRFVTTHLMPVPPPVPPPPPEQALLFAIQNDRHQSLFKARVNPNFRGDTFFRSCTWVISTLCFRSPPTGLLVDNSSRIDAWLKKNGMAASCPEPRPPQGDHDRTGCTCCQKPTLNNSTSELDHRIDLVIVPPGTDIAETKLVGADPPTPPHLWPSDHAGVVVSFFPPRTNP